MSERTSLSNVPFDETVRRRIVLLRHAEAAYFDQEGNRAPDSRLVPLTEKGTLEAKNRSDVLSGLHFDRAICSGLPRTQETARHILAQHPNLELEIEPRLEEVQGGSDEERPTDLSVAAYTMWDALAPESRFLGGEKFSDLWSRVDAALIDIMSDRKWTKLLLVCHGGINRMILTWMLLGASRIPRTNFALKDVDFYPFPAFEQDSCCINVFDVDQDCDQPYPRRTIFRCINHVPTDPLSLNSNMTTMEKLIRKRSMTER